MLDSGHAVRKHLEEVEQRAVNGGWDNLTDSDLQKLTMLRMDRRFEEFAASQTNLTTAVSKGFKDMAGNASKTQGLIRRFVPWASIGSLGATAGLLLDRFGLGQGL